MEQNFPGSCEVIRQAFLRRGTPPSTLDATIASLSKITIAQYAKPLRLWWTFCERNHSNYFSPPVSRVLEFLAGSLTAVRSYSTLNSYRSAISLIRRSGLPPSGETILPWSSGSQAPTFSLRLYLGCISGHRAFSYPLPS